MRSDCKSTRKYRRLELEFIHITKYHDSNKAFDLLNEQYCSQLDGKRDVFHHIELRHKLDEHAKLLKIATP